MLVLSSPNYFWQLYGDIPLTFYSYIHLTHLLYFYLPHLQDWSVKILRVEPFDSGTYKCQVNTHPPQYIATFLNIAGMTNFIAILSGFHWKRSLFCFACAMLYFHFISIESSLKVYGFREIDKRVWGIEFVVCFVVTKGTRLPDGPRRRV